MGEQTVSGPARLIEMAAVARRFYIDGRSKSEISDEMNLSRFKIARILDEALATGIVKIEISTTGRIDLDLSDRLQEAYGLQHSVVLDLDEPNVQAQRAALGENCAALLSEVVTEDDILGLAWGRSVRHMSTALRSLPPCSVVQLSGALRSSVPRPDVRDSTIELVRSVASVAQGPAAYFYAPMIVPNIITAQTLREQPDAARSFGLVPQVTIAVVGVGAWESGQSAVHDAFSRDERSRLHDDGVLVEIAGVLLDCEGRPVDNELTGRMITVQAEQLHAIPEVIGIAYGTGKAEAVRVAIRAGYLNSLVTHPALAHELIDLADQ